MGILYNTDTSTQERYSLGVQPYWSGETSLLLSNLASVHYFPFSQHNCMSKYLFSPFSTHDIRWDWQKILVFTPRLLRLGHLLELFKDKDCKFDSSALYCACNISISTRVINYINLPSSGYLEKQIVISFYHRPSTNRRLSTTARIFRPDHAPIYTASWILPQSGRNKEVQV